jgi:hypothetical protein
VSITRCSRVAKALGKIQGALATAIDQFDQAAQGWYEYQFPDCELDALRQALNTVVRATNVVQERLSFYADAFYGSHPPPKPLLPPLEELSNGKADDPPQQTATKKTHRGKRNATNAGPDLS